MPRQDDRRTARSEQQSDTRRNLEAGQPPSRSPSGRVCLLALGRCGSHRKGARAGCLRCSASHRLALASQRAAQQQQQHWARCVVQCPPPVLNPIGTFYFRWAQRQVQPAGAQSTRDILVLGLLLSQTQGPAEMETLHPPGAHQEQIVHK